MRLSVVTLVLLLSSCTGVRSVQLRPPVSPPAGLISGYGVERITDRADRARDAAYLKAMDDLLTRSSPVLVSKTVEDQTTVLNAKSANRTLESTFRLRASRILQPSFMDSGLDHGFVWVLVGTTEDEIARGWQQFVEWRAQKLAQAQKLFQEARGTERLSYLRSSLALLDESGAADDPGMLYYEVKAALEAETARIAELDKLQRNFHALVASGELAAAESALDGALRAGLDQATYQQRKMDLSDRRAQAAHLIEAGDDLVRDQQFNEALDRYHQAGKLDRDNPQLPAKISIAERYEREAHDRKVQATVGTIIPAATRVADEYFAYKREQERRKRAEAEAKKKKD
jgi:hypothetical protein